MQNPDLALWRSVLVAGLSDAAKGRDPKDVAWLRSDDFRLVCNLAGLDPDGVLRSYDAERFKRLPTRGSVKKVA